MIELPGACLSLTYRRTSNSHEVRAYLFLLFLLPNDKTAGSGFTDEQGDKVMDLLTLEQDMQSHLPTLCHFQISLGGKLL